MKHRIGIAGLGLLLALPGIATAGETPFRLIDDEEAARIREHMAALAPERREAYRDGIWAELRERARAHGYDMPETPPWKRAAPASSPADTAAPEPPLEERIARHRAVIEQAARERADAAMAATAENPAIRHYREQMRKRFEAFMAERRARREQARQRQQALARRPPPQAPAPPVAPSPGWAPAAPPGWAPAAPPGWTPFVPPGWAPAPPPRMPTPYWY